MDTFEEITEVFGDIVSEMTGDPSGMVQLSPEVVALATDGDNDPKFATFVIESGWSKSNRYWGPELFSDVASEINTAAINGEPLVGYLGHIKPEDDPYTFPEIQLQWLGARKLAGDGEKARLAVKAYVLPETKGRDYLRRKLVRTVSWRGKVAQEAFQKGVKIKKFMIESIDLARPRSAGMSAAMVGGLTSEMEGGDTEVKPEEIAALSENELRAHCPTLVATIEAAARKPLEERVSEMTTEAETVKPTLDLLPGLRKVLGLDENTEDLNVLQAAITSLKEQGKQLRDTVLASVLSKKFGDKDTGLLKQVLVGEMRERDITLTGDPEKDEKAVSEMVNEIIDGSDDLKKVVSEMEAAPPAPPVTSTSRSNSDKLKPGHTTTNIRVRSVTR